MLLISDFLVQIRSENKSSESSTNSKNMSYFRMYHLPFDIPDLHNHSRHSTNQHELHEYYRQKQKSLRGLDKSKSDFVKIADPKLNLNQMREQVFSGRFLGLIPSSSSKVTPKNDRSIIFKNKNERRINRRLLMSGDRERVSIDRNAVSSSSLIRYSFSSTLNSTSGLNELNITPAMNTTPGMNVMPAIDTTPAMNTTPVMDITPAMHATPPLETFLDPVMIRNNQESTPGQETPQGSIFRTPYLPPVLRRPRALNTPPNMDSTPESSHSASTLELVDESNDHNEIGGRVLNFEMSMDEEQLSSDEY